MLNKNRLGNTWLYAVYAFIHAEALGNKFEHVIKLVKDNPVSSFEQIWQYSTQRFCVLSFKAIRGLLVPKKEIFFFFFNIWVWKTSWSCDLEHLNIFSFPASHAGSIWHLASISWCFFFFFFFFFWGREVWKFGICVVLGKTQWMTLTLDCHKSSYIHSFDYMYQLPPHRLQ